MPTLTEGPGRSTGLVDVLDRVLDKGLVVAGDIRVSLAEVELLTIRIRLMICSIDKAEQIGLDWWKYDHHLSPGKQALSAENEELRKQVRLLERKLAAAAGRRHDPRRNGSATSALPAVAPRRPPSPRSHGSDVTLAVRLRLLEGFLSRTDIAECAQYALRWLADTTEIDQAICLIRP